MSDHTRRTFDQPWRRWYWQARWKRRRDEQRAKQPLCERCLSRSLIVPMTTADHVEPHRGDESKFWHGKLQSLCTPCHSGEKQREEHGRKVQTLDADGWPL